MIGRLENLPCLQCGNPLFDHDSDDVRHCLYKLTETETKKIVGSESDFRSFMKGGKCARCDETTLIYPDLGVCQRCYTELEGNPLVLEEKFA